MLQYIMIGVWIVFIIVTIIIEIETLDLISIWFTLGAVGALIAAALDADLLIQVGIFISISILLLLATRPLAKGMSKKQRIATNADRVVGMIGIITKEVTPYQLGEIKVDYSLWRATNLNNQTFEVGEKALIKAISGTKLVIAKITSGTDE